MIGDLSFHQRFDPILMDFTSEDVQIISWFLSKKYQVIAKVQPNDKEPTQENKSGNGSDQPTKSDGIPGNESDGSALFSLYVLISILVNTREALYTTIISYWIPTVGPNQIRWKIPH